jgi:taspase (threonine aspartase 1)
MNAIKTGISALDTVENAVKMLEDCPLTNAGIGSSLNWDGMVECDAAIMEGQTGLFGSVGAVPGIVC